MDIDDIRNRGYVGTLHGVRIEVDERVTKSNFYVTNNRFYVFSATIKLARWQRLINYIKGKLRISK